MHSLTDHILSKHEQFVFKLVSELLAQTVR